MFLTLEQAAKRVGYSVRGLRKLVQRRAIRFYQPHRGCPIKFRPKWLDEFLRRSPLAKRFARSPGTDAERPSSEDEGPPQTLSEAIAVYSPDVALALFLSRLYRDCDPYCFLCSSTRVHFDTCGTGRCRQCRRKFSIRDQTKLDRLPGSLRAWIIAAWCVTAGKDRISARTFASSLRISVTRGERILSTLRELL